MQRWRGRERERALARWSGWQRPRGCLIDSGQLRPITVLGAPAGPRSARRLSSDGPTFAGRCLELVAGPFSSPATRLRLLGGAVTWLRVVANGHNTVRWIEVTRRSNTESPAATQPAVYPVYRRFGDVAGPAGDGLAMLLPRPAMVWRCCCPSR